MATKQLKSIKFPGLEDTYVIPENDIELDTTLQVEGMAADAKAVGDALADAGNIDIDLEGATEGEAAPIDADTLDGVSAQNYVKKDDMINYGLVEKNYSIVGGSTEPENPTENMIWVQTNDEDQISEYIFSKDEPIIKEGLVWVYTGNYSNVSFASMKFDNIYMHDIRPTSVKQYIGGVWEAKTAKIWQGNEWCDIATDLFRNGNINTQLTGGIYGTNNGTALEFVRQNIEPGQSVHYTTKNKVDITGFSTMKVSFYSAGTIDNIYFRIFVDDVSSNGVQHSWDDLIAINVKRGPFNGNTFILKLDLSTIPDGLYYLGYAMGLLSSSSTSTYMSGLV